MKDLEYYVQILIAGGIVIFPTDTAYGIGCRIDNREAIDRLFRMRHRPKEQAVPVLVSSTAQALEYYSSPSKIVRRFMYEYWPGALTIVAPCKTKSIYSLIRGGGGTIGLRMPDHEMTLSLISRVGVPILGPSANLHGEKTPYRWEDLDPDLVALVDGVVEGRCKIGNVSTVVDCSVEPYRILRQGAVVVQEKGESA